MADFNINQKQVQGQFQTQKLSQKMIQSLNYLHMSTNDLRDAIYKEVENNPALEIVYDPKRKRDSSDYDSSYYSSMDGEAASDRNQQAIDNSEDTRKESLQTHLLKQVGEFDLSEDEYKLSEALIYNLDKDGCYGSSRSPETLLDKKRPLQNKEMLQRCIRRIQKMDPVGTCCKDLEESLYVQALILGDASPLTLFILNKNLSLINPPEVSSVLRKLHEEKRNLRKKEFVKYNPLKDIELTEENVEESIDYIRENLNPRPAQGYTQLTLMDLQQPDVVAIVEPIPGPSEDNIEKGIIKGNEKYHFQVKYASGSLPEVRISQAFIDAGDKDNVRRGKDFLDMLSFRESTLMEQICTIVIFQRSFFLKGEKYLKPLTRKDVATTLNIHESTVSRLSSKKYSKYIQTHNGLYPLSFFFTSGLTYKGKNGEKKISSEVIKIKIKEILDKNDGKNLSDNALTKILNDMGLEIARRTVAKYRSQIGIENSYKRNDK